MKNILHKIRQFLLSNSFQVAVTFFISGILAGAFFTWLTYLPALESFFFVPDRKFTRIALFSWYVAFGLLFASGLAAAFLISRRHGEFVRKFNLTKGRSLLSLVIVAGAMPISYGLFGLMYRSLDGNLLLVLPALFLASYSAAMCAATRSFRLLPAAFLTNLFHSLIAAGFIALTYPLARKQGPFVSEFVQWTVLFSLQSLGFGLWLTWRASREGKKSA